MNSNYQVPAGTDCTIPAPKKRAIFLNERFMAYPLEEGCYEIFLFADDYQTMTLDVGVTSLGAPNFIQEI